MMNIKVLEDKEGLSFHASNFLAKSVGWGECYYGTEERWQRVINASSHIAYVKEEDRLICSSSDLI